MILKLIFTLFLIFAPAVSVSQTSPFCEKEALAQIKKINATGTWFDVPATDGWLQIKRSPTSTIGTWVEWRSHLNQLEVVQISNDFQKMWTWKKDQCQQPLISTPNFKTVDKKATFNDANISQILKSHKKTIIYIWNPGAVYSVQYKKVFKAEAKKRNLNWIEVESKNLAALELIFRGGLMHFPTSYLLGNNKISRKIVGALENENISSYFDEYEMDIK